MKQVCTVITVTRGAFDFSQSKPSKVKYKCYNTAWLGICLIYTHLPSGAARPRASCVYIGQTPRGCVITYTYIYIYILYIYTHVRIYTHIDAKGSLVHVAFFMSLSAWAHWFCSGFSWLDRVSKSCL